MAPRFLLGTSATAPRSQGEPRRVTAIEQAGVPLRAKGAVPIGNESMIGAPYPARKTNFYAERRSIALAGTPLSQRQVRARVRQSSVSFQSTVRPLRRSCLAALASSKLASPKLDARRLRQREPFSARAFACRQLFDTVIGPQNAAVEPAQRLLHL
jgi:hypothetical protein